MTWSANIQKTGGENVNCHEECRHAETCNIWKASWPLASVLTSVDVCGDGHMASGTAKLECNGFEPKE